MPGMENFAPERTLTSRGLQLFEGGIHLFVHVLANVATHVLAAGFGLNGESRRHGKPSVGHLGKPGTFTAQGVLHLAIAFGFTAAEGIDILDCCHCGSSHSFTL
jgi:hypothetical protein